MPGHILIYVIQIEFINQCLGEKRGDCGCEYNNVRIEYSVHVYNRYL